MRRLALAFLLASFVPSLVRAESPTVFISEVAWAGSSASTADEWFEIANAAASSADLSGWSVEGASAAPLVFPDGSVIPAGGTFLVANYGADDPKTTLAAAPDWITTAVALSNGASWLVLRDASGAVMDEAGASGTAPFAGSTGTTKASMSRRRPLLPGSAPNAWETSTAAAGFDAGAAELGSPGIHVFDDAIEAPSETVMPEDSATTAPDIAPAALPPPPVESPATEAPGAGPMAALRLSEIASIPAGGEAEWIEIVNPSGIGEVLSGWMIEDGKGTATPLEGVLLPWTRLVVEAPKGKLNDDGDLVVLKDARGRVVDAVAYGDWDASAARVEAPKRGESAMRAELRDEWALTTTPTKGAANVMTPRAAAQAAIPLPKETPAPVSATPAEAGAQTEKTEQIPRLQPASQASASPFAKASGDRRDDKKIVTPAKAVAQKPPKKTSPRFKGLAYEATVAVPPGVYGKTRMLVTVAGRLRELRLNRSTTAAYEPGERIRFVAQEKREDEVEFLLANVNSFSTHDLVEEPEFAPTDRWPEAPGAFALEGTVSAVEAKRLLLLLDGREGSVVLPSDMGKPALKQGDAVRVLGFVAATSTPMAYLADPTALTLVKGYVEAKDLPDAKPRLPWAAAAALTSIAAVAGVLAYLRHQRLQRLAFAGQAPSDDLDEEE